MTMNPLSREVSTLPLIQLSTHAVCRPQAPSAASKPPPARITAIGLPEGYVYRLPAEAEWEYACRAKTSTRFSFGDDPGYVLLGVYAWYGPNSEGTPQPVGKKQPNPWGLYDMYGNVSEWCLDDLGHYSGVSVIDPVGMSGKFVATKGGSWKSDGASCRSGFRHSVAL